jgi:serine/threonine protein phosphatase PrpC
MRQIDCHGLTDRGAVRTVNEDRFLIADLHRSIFIHQTNMPWENHSRLFDDTQGLLLLVADGGSSKALGVEASSMVVQTITHYILSMMPWFYQLSGQQTGDFVDHLTVALTRCQERIQATAEVEPTDNVMGMTLTMAYIIWPRLYVVHVGHSRCYLLRQHRLEQITTDHTLAQQLVESGVLPSHETKDSRLSRVLWNAIGGNNEELSPDVYTAELQWGDTLMLCTDGLSRYVDEHDIRTELQTQNPAQTTCQKLIDAAKQTGSPDNVTVVVARFHPDVHLSEMMSDAAEQREPVAVSSTLVAPDTAAVPPLEPALSERTAGCRR